MESNMSLRKALGVLGLVAGAVVLLLVPSGCFLFKTTLTIENQSSAELDFIDWTDQSGETFYFGRTLVWDPILSSWEYGLSYNDSDTVEVGSGADYVYFFFSTSSVGYRTAQVVSVDRFEEATFTFYDSTLIVSREAGSGGTTTEVYDIVPSGRVKPGSE
jgi:hypothetical protein